MTSHPEEALARLPKEAVMKKLLGWALDILDALRYIHRKGFAHLDLKLDNILVSSCRGLTNYFFCPTLVSVHFSHFCKLLNNNNNNIFYEMMIFTSTSKYLD